MSTIKISKEDLDEIQAKFKEVDVNNDGFCDKTEVKTAMQGAGVEFTDDEFNDYFNDIDENGDGKLSMEEIINKFKRDMQNE